MIIVDLSQVIISGCIVQLSKELKNPDHDAKGLIKHMTFNTLVGFKTKWGREFGKLVLACDNREYWRREFFPAYKGHRKHDRKKSDLDFAVIFETINEIKDDIRKNFPWMILDVHGAEGDDIGAIMVKYLQENELEEGGLFGGTPQKVKIISSDGDFCQLQKYDNVYQWNNQHKKEVKLHIPVVQFINEHVMEGDSTDNIPNVLTPDKWAEDKAAGIKPSRQAVLTAARRAQFVSEGVNACANDMEKANWSRNKTLVDFDSIPAKVTKDVIDAYTNYKYAGNKMKLMSYLTTNRMKQLFANMQNI